MTTETTDRPACLCGCGDYPKGKKSRFIPGHDARYHSAQKKAAAEAAPVAPAAVNAQARHPASARRRKAKESATKSAGSEA